MESLVSVGEREVANRVEGGQVPRARVDWWGVGRLSRRARRAAGISTRAAASTSGALCSQRPSRAFSTERSAPSTQRPASSVQRPSNDV